MKREDMIGAAFIAYLLLLGLMWCIEYIACDGIILLSFLAFAFVTWLIIDKKSLTHFYKDFLQIASALGVAFALLVLTFTVRLFESSPVNSVVLVDFPVLMVLALLLVAILKEDRSTFNLIIVKIACVCALILSAIFYMKISATKESLQPMNVKINTIMFYVACLICITCAKFPRNDTKNLDV